MTARFGRNKRRAAREAVAQAERQTVYWTERAKDSNKHAADALWEASRMRGQVDEVVDALVTAFGEQSAFIPFDRAPIVRGDHIRRWPVHPRPQEMAVEMVRMRDEGMRVVDVLHLVALATRDHERYGVYVRFKDANDTGETAGGGLYISREAFMNRGVTEQEIAYMLEAQIRPIAGHLSDERRMKSGRG